MSNEGSAQVAVKSLPPFVDSGGIAPVATKTYGVS